MSYNHKESLPILSDDNNNHHLNSYQSIVSNNIPNTNDTKKHITTTSATTTNTTENQSNHHSNRTQNSSSWIQFRPMEYNGTTPLRKYRVPYIIFMISILILMVGTICIWWYHTLIYENHHPLDHTITTTSTNDMMVINTTIYHTMQHNSDMALQYLNSNTPSSIVISDSTSQHQKDNNNYSSSNTCETTLLVLRHCDKLQLYEKDVDTTDTNNTDMKRDQHCSPIGYDRAQYISSLFGNNTSYHHRYPIPIHLYALSPHRHSGHVNYREYETLYPLSQAIHQPIEMIDDLHHNTFANQYFFPLLLQGTNSTLCHHISVISWKHSHIPDLVNSLGCGPNNGCPISYPIDTFDQIWQIKFIYQQAQPQLPNHDEGNYNNSTIQNDDDESIIHSIPQTSTIPDLYDVSKNLKKKHHHHLNHYKKKHHNDDDDTTTIQSPIPWTTTTTTTTSNDHNNDDSKYGHWTIIGTVTQQMFDPLAYSTQTGVYH